MLKNQDLLEVVLKKIQRKLQQQGKKIFTGYKFIRNGYDSLIDKINDINTKYNNVKNLTHDYKNYIQIGGKDSEQRRYFRKLNEVNTLDDMADKIKTLRYPYLRKI